MASLDLGGIASWLLFAFFGVAILWAENTGHIQSEYSAMGTRLPMDTLGLGILLFAIALGILYFGMDIAKKI